MSYPKPHELLRDLGRPISFYPELAKRIGIPLSIFICQLLYWTPRAGDKNLGESDGEGWIYKDAKEIERETSLSYEQQLLARKKALRLGLIEEKYKRFEHRQFFRLKLEALDEVLAPGESLSRKEVLAPGESPSRDLGFPEQAPRESPGGTWGKPKSFKGSSYYSETTQLLKTPRRTAPRNSAPQQIAASAEPLTAPPAAQPAAALTPTIIVTTPQPAPPAAQPAAAAPLTPANDEKEQADRRKVAARDRRLAREAVVAGEVRVGEGPAVGAITFVDCQGCSKRVTSIARSLCDRGKCPHLPVVPARVVDFRPLRPSPPSPAVSVAGTASEREEFLANLRAVAARFRF